MQVVTLSVFHYDIWPARIEAFTQMGRARFSLPNIPGIGFFKLLGTGSRVGFTPIPNIDVNAILATWESHDAAQEGIARGLTYRHWRDNADESWTVYMAPSSARGLWSGQAPFEVCAEPAEGPQGPVAALTRATVKLPVATQFWREVPDISQVIGQDPNVLFKIGMGEVPLLQQVTFSIWPDTKTMANFARKDGPHATAIRHVREGDWFKEELYARFRILGDEGSWGGKSPLDRARDNAASAKEAA